MRAETPPWLAGLAELDERARATLEAAERAPPRRPGKVHLRLWHYPAFEAWRSWTVITPVPTGGHDPNPLVRELTWDQPGDKQRLIDPMAGLRTLGQPLPTPPARREARLAATALQSLLEGGRSIAVPLVTADRGIGIDGERWGFEDDRGLDQVRIQWWCEGPPEWQPFIAWAGELRAFFQEALDRQNP